jgi:hypothetical protein
VKPVERETLALKVKLALKVLLDYRVNRVLEVSMEIRVLLDHRV